MNTQHSALSTQHSTLNTHRSTINTQHSTLNTQHSTLNARYTTLNPQPSTLNTQHSTLNTQHSTLNTQHSTLHADVSGTALHRLASRSGGDGCHHVPRRGTGGTPQTPDPGGEYTPHPTPKTQHLTAQTPNPELQTYRALKSEP